MAETGVVINYNADKRYGFLRLSGGESLFFHFNDGSRVIAGEKCPFILPRPVDRRARAELMLAAPKIGDILVFEKTIDPHKRPEIKWKASPWAYKSSWIAAEYEINNRVTYRVFETMNALGDPAGEPKVLFEGWDIYRVIGKYPLPKWGRSPGSDPLLPYSADNDNIFEIHRWWQSRVGAGQWEDCEDPRPDFAV